MSVFINNFLNFLGVIVSVPIFFFMSIGRYWRE